MPTFAIIPAAGRSQRMGRPKLLLPWRGSTVIEHVLNAWKASRVSRVVIVVRADDEALGAHARRCEVDIVQPPVAPPEMKDSVRVGLDYISAHFQPTEGCAWLLAPADMPGIVTATIDALIAEHEAAIAQGAPLQILLPAKHGRRGHPVLFPWPMAAHLERLAAHEGVNAIVERNPNRMIEVPELSHDDLDTPADYRRLQGE